MQAIILAGGFGTRIRSTIGAVPKPMAPIIKGNATIPFLEFLLRHLKKHGINKVVIAVHFLKENIIDYFGYFLDGLEIEYAIEDEPLGTGGAIVNASQYIDQDKFIVLNGDTFLECDYAKLFRCDNLTVVLKHQNDCGRYGKVELNQGRIVKFLEKKEEGAGLINGGVYLITKRNLLNLPKAFSFETDFLYKQPNVNALISEGYFIDIGVPEDYKEAKENLCKNVCS